MRCFIFFALLSVALGGCATAQFTVAPDVSGAVARKLTGTDRYANISFFVTPFFGDDSKLFLSPTAPELVDLVNNPDGTAIAPGAPIRILEAGAAVRIDKIEFPSARTMSERVLTTPRTLAWIYLTVADAPPNAPPHILVLRPGLDSEHALWSEIERMLSEFPLKQRLSEMSAVERKSIATKTLSAGIGREALEKTLGYPLEGEKQKEVWRWGLGKNSRTVTIIDGFVNTSGAAAP
jgi:hypothetical protein